MNASLKTFRKIAWGGMLMVTATLCGCGGGSYEPSQDSQVVAQVVSLNDAVSDPKMFGAAFASGSAPADAEAYQGKIFDVNGTPSISGNTATVPVSIKGGGIDSSQGDKPVEAKIDSTTPVEVTWTLKRDEEGWKIQDAPLQ